VGMGAFGLLVPALIYPLELFSLHISETKNAC
jgi:hypothetical protein